MKRLLVIISFCLLLCGCGDKQVQLAKHSFSDNNHGFITTITYDLASDFVFSFNEDINEEYANMQITSDKLNVIVDMTYDEISKEQYTINRSSNVSYDNYQEHLYNSYEAYSFSSSKDSLYLIILLGNEEAQPNPSLIISFMLKDNKKDTNLYEVFNSKDIQSLLESIQFQKIN